MQVLKNGNIHVGNGTVLNKTDLGFEDGKIVAIGQNLTGEVIDCTNQEILPGFIDCNCAWGSFGPEFGAIENSETINPIAPQLNLKYAFNPDLISYQELPQYGITTIGLAPSDDNVISGMIAVFKTFGKSYKELFISEQNALKGSITANVKKTYLNKKAPNTRMKEIELLVEAFRNADRKEKDLSYGEIIIKKVIAGEMGLFMSANTALEISAIIEVLKPYPNLKLTICNSYHVKECISEIEASHVNLVIGDQSQGMDPTIEVDNDSIYELFKKGVNLAISASNTENIMYGREMLIWNATYFLKAGFNSEEVLQMITLNPAKFLNIQERVGSLEVGKDADFSIWSANPLVTYQGQCLATYLNGNKVYQRGKSC